MKPNKKCKQCNHLSKVVIDGFAICKLKHVDVWVESQACSEIDDTLVF